MLRQELVGSTLVLTLDHPEKRNPMTAAIRAGLREGFLRAENDASIRVVVMTGAGGNFCSGGDIDSMSKVTDLAAGRERFRTVHELARLIIGSSKPCIAALEGWTAGAGLALALSADIVIASRTARFISGFGRIGLVPDFGLLATLPARIGHGRARNMLMTGDPVDADEALRIGLVDELVAPQAVLEAALEKAAKIARNAPLSLAYMKAALTMGVDSVLNWEREAQAALLMTRDHAEGRKAFAEKRAPVFEGR